MRRLHFAAAALTLSMALFSGGTVFACPGCKEAVANQQTPESVGLRNGYFWSIVFMLTVPAGLACTGVTMVVRAVKRGALPEM